MSSERWCNFQELETVITDQFSGPVYSLHGPSHWRRVKQNGIWISRRSNADEFIVKLFALFHDSKRLDDGTDPGHGQRGAEYAELLRGSYFELSDSDFEILRYACIWHTDKDHSDNITVGACWDSDRLDLGRVGVIPSDEFMNTEIAKSVAKVGSFYPFLQEDEKQELAVSNSTLQEINPPE